MRRKMWASCSRDGNPLPWEGPAPESRDVSVRSGPGVSYPGTGARIASRRTRVFEAGMGDVGQIRVEEAAESSALGLPGPTGFRFEDPRPGHGPSGGLPAPARWRGRFGEALGPCHLPSREAVDPIEIGPAVARRESLVSS